MKKTESKLIDSSVWLDYLFNGAYSDMLESDEILLLSSLSLLEIKRKLLKSKIENSKISRIMEFIKKRSLTIPVSEEISEKAADISFQKGLSAIDALIYTTAIFNDSILLTLDNDFRGLKNVTLLK